MVSFPTACQSGGLRAGRRADWLAGACGLRCAPAARQGPIAAAAASQWQTPEIQTIPNPQNDRTLATNSQRAGRAPPRLPDSEARFIDGLGGLRPGWQVSVSLCTRGRKKNQPKNLHRDHTWAGAEAWSAEETITGHLSRTGRSEAVSATPRVTPKSGAKKTALHSSPKDQWPPIIAWAKSYGLHDVVRAWEKKPIPSRTRIFDQWVTEDPRHRSCVPPSETSREGWLPLCGFAATTSSRDLICCCLWSSGNTVKFLRRYTHYIRRYCVLS